jgi:LacI family transcriptional regulator/LacI family purine nucleotide synthesis repressor
MTNQQGAVTLADVAARAGVNKVTVSVVLNNTASNTRVSDATRQRILDAAAALRYRPNAIARSLRRRRTNIVGLYSGHRYLDARNEFLAEIIGGMQEGCAEHRKDLLLHGIFERRDPDDVYAELADGRIDGLVLHSPPDDPLAARLAESHLPVVAIADAVPVLPSVVADDIGGGRLQAEHLAGRGHHRVLYRGPHRPFASALRRRDAFLDAAGRLGLVVVEDPESPQWPEAGGLTAQERAWLTAGEPETRPTALVCWADGCADDLLYACCDSLGLRVPDNLAVVGFNGIPSPRRPRWELTTVRAPWREVARTAIALLSARIEGQEVARETVLPVKLITGGTT